MAGERWCVVVVRAWGEADGLRVRLLRSGDGGDESAVERSADTAGRRLTTWLESLVDGDKVPPADDAGATPQ
jgi:hypothetical protein